jgi:glycosyltransferase involved in cell wall biosynthesis
MSASLRCSPFPSLTSSIAISGLVSIVIPTHKRPALLQETIESSLAQDYKDLEIIVVDDAGEPPVASLALRAAQQRPGVRYVDRTAHLPGGGGQQARNLGRKLAQGQYILFLDDDDLLSPTCISRRVERLRDDGEAGACVGQCAVFRDTPKPDDPLWRVWITDQDDLEKFLSNRVPWQTSGPLWRATALDSVGPWDESLQGGHDYEFHIRALARGINFCKLSEIDYFWRAPRPDSYSGHQAFKIQHQQGAHIEAMCKGMQAIDRNCAWTRVRRAAAWKESVRLAMLCRLNGGRHKTAQKVLSQAKESGCAPHGEFIEASLAIASWFRVGDKIPALSFLHRRGLIEPDAAGTSVQP